MGEMADDLMDLMERSECWEIEDVFDLSGPLPGRESYEERCAKTPQHLWIMNNGQRIEITRMETSHAGNAIRMLRRWVAAGRGKSEAAIVGKKRWENLLKRSGEAK